MVWVVVNTLVNKEAQAIGNLRRQGFRIYCPMFRKQRRHARRVEVVSRPLFPGYLFLDLDLERDRWRAIQSTLGVRSLITFGSKLGTLPKSFVESLRARERDGFVDLPETEAAYCAGEQVRIKAGGLENIVATVLSVDARDRLVVLLQFMDRTVRARLTSDQIIPA